MRGRVGAAALTALLAGCLLTAGPAAAVQPANHTVVTNPDPANHTPHVLDGQVNAVAEIGNVVLVGGQFTQIQDDLGGPVISRANLFAFDATTDEILTTFQPTVPSAVYEIVPSGDGTTAYVGGQFANINGAARTNRLARVNATTGATSAAFVSPGFDGIVKDLALRNGVLYVGGSFVTAGGVPRSLLAAVDPTTGALSDAVNLTFTDPRNGGNLQIIKFDVTPDGHKLVAIGNFAKVGGLDRYQIVMIDLTTNPATVSDWQTTKFTSACSASFDTYMRDVDISTDGTYFIVGTTGAYSGGPNAGTLCDSNSRWPIAATGPNQVPTWADYTGGDTTWAVDAGGAAVYVGGHFRWMNNPYASDKAGQGAVAREGLAALDPRNGLPLTWNPGRDRGVGVFALVSTERGLWVGSDTDRIGNNEYHGRIALFPTDGGQKLPDDFTGALPGSVYSLGTATADTVTKRAFTGSAVTGTASVPNGGVAWSTSRGAFMVDGTLFTGQFNGSTAAGTLLARSFDGTTFGAPTTVDLHGLTNFGTELRTVTGTFFDAATGRLYFTLAGASTLYYRFFTPESRTVGAERYTASANLTDLNWSQVSSMFRVGDALYVASSVDGKLRRYQWNPATGAPVAGTGTVVDSSDWRSRGAFVYAPLHGANQPPTATFTSTCSGLQCSVDATGSTDADGSIASVAWTFGDGGTATTTQASHLYAAGGTYPVTLTVTDDVGATATSTQQVTVTAPVSQIAFRAATGADASSNQVAVTVPASVQAGDTLVLVATANDATVTVGSPTGLTGWTQQKALTGNTMQSVVWSRTATATDAGATVRVPLSATAKLGVQLLAYSGSTAAAPVATVTGVAETVAQATHTTPSGTVATTGSYAGSYWSDKTTDTASWTVPGGVTARGTTLGTGAGHITSVTADPGTGAGTGAAGGLTATASSSNSKAIMWSIVIAP